MKYLILIAALLLNSIILLAQNRIPFVTGKVFDYTQNEELNKLINQEGKINGRKIILDLFTSSCVVCFRMMPKMKEIQEKYRNSLSVILIGDDDPDIRKVYERFKVKFSLDLKVLYDSTLFSRYSLGSVPRYIWLDENGIIQAVTGTDELNEKYIERFISEMPMDLKRPVAKQNFDNSRLLLSNGNGGPDSSFLFRSVLSLWNESQPNSYPASLNYSKNGAFFQVLNVSIADLYRYAYFGWAWWSMKDSVYGRLYSTPVVLGNDSIISGNKKYNYSFKSNVNGSDKKTLQTALRNDLATYFGYEVQVVERLMPCWKLIVTSQAKENLRSKMQNRKMTGSYTTVNYQRVPISAVIELFTFSRQDNAPIIDATGIDFPVDIFFEAVLYDREAVIHALRKYGLDLIPGETSMKVLLLQKK
jgi:thiol-disulfide isomerase/thioredoxin